MLVSIGGRQGDRRVARGREKVIRLFVRCRTVVWSDTMDMCGHVESRYLDGQRYCVGVFIP